MSQRLVATLLLLGCSNDKASSLEPSKRTRDLSISETAQYCTELSTLRSRRLGADADKLTCFIKGRRAAGYANSDDEARAACRSEFDRCMQKPPADKQFDCMELGPLLSCKQLTVGDLDACLEDRLDRQREALRGDPCGSVTVTGNRAEPSPKCQAITMRCSGSLFDDEPSAAAEAVETMERFSRSMCDCHDKKCADKVNEDMTRWGTEMAKQSGAHRDEKPDPELAKRSSDIMTRYTECMTKLTMAGAEAQ